MEIDPALMQAEESLPGSDQVSNSAISQSGDNHATIPLSSEGAYLQGLRDIGHIGGGGQTTSQSYCHPSHGSLSAGHRDQFGDSLPLSHRNVVPGTLDYSSSTNFHTSEAPTNAASYDFSNGHFDDGAKLWPRKDDSPWESMDRSQTDIISHSEENTLARSTNDESYPIDPRLWASNKDNIDEQDALR
jgi:hypothetical protein